jgi:hypothetical protein
MILGNHPGPWQSYVKRADNIGLHILEVRNKYLQEQLQYDNQLSQMYSMQNFQPKGRVPVAIDPTSNDFVVDDYVEDYLV